MNLLTIYQNHPNFINMPMQCRKEPRIVNFFSKSIPSFSNPHIFSNLEFVDLRNQKMTDLFKIIQKNSEIPLIYLCHGKTLQEIEFIFLGELHGDPVIRKINTLFVLLFCHTKTKFLWHETEKPEEMLEIWRLPKRLVYHCWDKEEKSFLKENVYCQKILDAITKYTHFYFFALYEKVTFKKEISFENWFFLIQQFVCIKDSIDELLKQDIMQAFKKKSLEMEKFYPLKNTSSLISFQRIEELKQLFSISLNAYIYIVKLKSKKRQLFLTNLVKPKKENITAIYLSGSDHHAKQSKEKLQLEPLLEETLLEHEKEKKMILFQPNKSYVPPDSFFSEVNYYFCKVYDLLCYYKIEKQKNPYKFPLNRELKESEYAKSFKPES